MSGSVLRAAAPHGFPRRNCRTVPADIEALQIALAFSNQWIGLWLWMTLIVGLIIIVQWPVSTAYAPGYLAGISLIFSGWSYVMMSLAAKRI